MTTAQILSLCTLPLPFCWSLDVWTTWQGLKRCGHNIELEVNPFARWIFRRLGVPGGFVAFALIEIFIVALHWLYAWQPWPFSPSPAMTWLIGSCILFLAACHALAAWCNHHQRLHPLAVPIFHFFRWLDRKSPKS